MAKNEQIENKVVVQPEVWIGRLTDLLKIVSAMEPDERSAAFSFLKSKYRGEWPSDAYQ